MSDPVILKVVPEHLVELIRMHRLVEVLDTSTQQPKYIGCRCGAHFIRSEMWDRHLAALIFEEGQR